MQALNDYGTLCALVEDHGGTILAPKSGQELVIAPDLTVQIPVSYTHLTLPTIA